MIAFQEINRLLPALDVLHVLCLEEYGHNSEQWRGRCPFHRSTSRRSRSFSVSLTLRKFFCHKCKESGDLIDLWAELHQIDLHRAALDLANRFL